MISADGQHRSNHRWPNSSCRVDTAGMPAAEPVRPSKISSPELPDVIISADINLHDSFRIASATSRPDCIAPLIEPFTR